MNQTVREACVRLTLALPVAVVVLGLTAASPPIRSASTRDIRSIADLRFDPVDVAANLILFVPLGIVVARRGIRTTLAVAAAISMFAESTQLWSTTRTASVIDVVANVAGAAVGWGVVVHTRNWDPSTILVTRRRAVISLGLAIGCGVFGATTTPKDLELDLRAWLRQEPESNPRGTSQPGRLEGQWTFDEDPGADVVHNSVDGSSARAAGDSGRAEGVDGGALALDGTTQYVDVGDQLPFRLAGSMTLTAWIRVARFPIDDAPIASTLDTAENGFQLDATVDTGPRVIGFKLGGLDDRLMARYGVTPLLPGVWYHLVGVYDANRQTMHVYLDGRPDDGCLRGSITPGQRPSTAGLLFGRRPGLPQYLFSGLLDDVRIYSRALSDAEISAMAAEGNRLPEQSRVGASSVGTCAPAPDPRSGGLTVGIGCLTAFAAIGLAGLRRRPLVVGSLAGLAAGVILWPILGGTGSHAAASWPSLLALIGGAAVGISVHVGEVHSRR